ncbi:MAG: nucleotide exchange factor GrpE [Chitinophagaceae bacterium]|nr:nucleotide exchange factor GrpE [Chitinophagaceae bacterium]
MKDSSNKDIDNQEDMISKDVDNFNENADMTEELETVKAELAEQKDKYLRLYAEFDNFKRRNAKERIDLIQTAGKEVIISLLDVLDDCDRAEAQIRESDQPQDAIQEGVLLIFNKLRTTLISKGLRPMNCVGQEFNPDEQEALSQVPVTEEKLKGKVVDEIVKGYYLNDKIIRFAKVVVGH